jgi:hypothetical protein
VAVGAVVAAETPAGRLVPRPRRRRRLALAELPRLRHAQVAAVAAGLPDLRSRPVSGIRSK